jgi:hypothetical protein
MDNRKGNIGLLNELPGQPVRDGPQACRLAMKLTSIHRNSFYVLEVYDTVLWKIFGRNRKAIMNRCMMKRREMSFKQIRQYYNRLQHAGRENKMVVTENV